jgi:hypothetical protein
MRSKQLDRGEVQRALREQLHDQRKLPAQARGLNAQVRLCLGHVQLVHAVRKHRSVGVLAVQPARIHLAEVHEQSRAERVVGANQAPQAVDQRSIRDGTNIDQFHDQPPLQDTISITCVFRSPLADARWRGSTARRSFEITPTIAALTAPRGARNEHFDHDLVAQPSRAYGSVKRNLSSQQQSVSSI